MSRILLSIKPEYVEKIYAGTKKYEYRKRIANSDVDAIVIYVTSPECCVTGEMKVTEVICASPSALWERTKSDAGICRKKFRDYFRGSKKAYAYCIDSVKKYEKPLSLETFGLTKAPQSFVYLDD